MEHYQDGKFENEQIRHNYDQVGHNNMVDNLTTRLSSQIDIN